MKRHTVVYQVKVSRSKRCLYHRAALRKHLYDNDSALEFLGIPQLSTASETFDGTNIVTFGLPMEKVSVDLSRVGKKLKKRL